MSRYALVIGIAEYTGSFKSLETPVNNANAIADLLVQHGNFKQVKRLPSRVEQGQKDLGKVIKKSLTSENLTRELQQFLQDANGSEVLIYFSGHGFTRFDKLSGEKEGFLATSNCEVELDAEKRVITAKNGISLYSLNTLIKKHKFNSLVVILDCCNAGAFVESDMVRRDVTAFAYEWDHYFITACRGSRKAYEGEDYSLLTQAVLKGLARENAPKSGRISGDGLFSVVGEELYNSRQEPLRMGWGSGITLVEYHDLPSNNQEAAQPAFDPANPYVGLKAFESNQADYFHGRERAVRALLDRLNDNRFLAVIGPSGCGKSSLVKAGLLPELKADRIPGSHNWVVASFTPGRDPLTVLSDAFSHPPATDQTIVLFIDQFEELFTLCDNEEVQRQFIKRLHEETSKPDQQTRVILTMRGDFLDRCAKFEEAADLINTQVPTTYVVTPLTGRELAEAIAQPALMHGATFEDGLVDKILEDVADQQGALPLLQYALFELWKRCIENSPTPYTPHPIPHLTLSGYTEIGGVKGALQRRADQLYQEGFTESERSLFWELMRELVEVSEEKATRRRATRNQLSPSLLQIARKLADQRLLMIDDATVEVAHEALLSEWSLLRDWIEENRNNIHLSRRLELDCQEWLEKSQSNDYLLTGGRLSAIEEWVEKNQPNLLDLQIEFLKKSVERRDRDFLELQKLKEEAEARAKAEEEKKLIEIEKTLEAEARAEAETAKSMEAEARIKAEKRRTQIAIGGGILVTALMITVGSLQLQMKEREGRVQKDLAIRALTSASKTSLEMGNQLEALVTTVKALKQLKNESIKIPVEMNNIVRQVSELNRLEGHTQEVLDAEFNSDGNYVVSSGVDQTIKIWTTSGKLLRSFKGHNNSIWGVSFDAHTKNILSASADKTVKLWNTNGKIRKTLRENNSTTDTSYLKAVFSPDETLIAAASWDKTIKIWRIVDGKLIRILKGHKDAVYDLKFSFDGKLIASGSWDHTVKIWRVKDGKLIHSLKGHKDAVEGVDFSRDSEILASASWDNTVKIWRVKDGKLLRTLQGHTDDIFDVSISPDKRIIASASKDTTIRIWNIEDGNLLQILKGHKDGVNRVEFSPNGKSLVSASDDHTIRLWSIGYASSLVPNSNELLIYSCNRLNSYLKNNPKVSAEDSKVCKEL